MLSFCCATLRCLKELSFGGRESSPTALLCTASAVRNTHCNVMICCGLAESQKDLVSSQVGRFSNVTSEACVNRRHYLSAQVCVHKINSGSSPVKYER